MDSHLCVGSSKGCHYRVTFLFVLGSKMDFRAFDIKKRIFPTRVSIPLHLDMKRQLDLLMFMNIPCEYAFC